MYTPWHGDKWMFMKEILSVIPIIYMILLYLLNVSVLQNILYECISIHCILRYFRQFSKLHSRTRVKNIQQSSKKNTHIKYICQTLKLTGFSLESSCKEDLNIRITTIEAIKYKVSEYMVDLINNILELRAVNWDIACIGLLHDQVFENIYLTEKINLTIVSTGTNSQ